MPKVRALGFTELRAALTLEYNDDKIVTVTLLRGEVDEVFFKMACWVLFKKHPYLRCSLKKKSSNYCLEENVTFESVTLLKNKFSCFDIDLLIHAIQKKLQEQLFISQALWRVNLFLFSPNIVALVLEFHHAIADGISSAYLAHELLCLYAQLKNHAPLTIQPMPWLRPIEDLLDRPPVSFIDYFNSLENELKNDHAHLFQASHFEKKQPVILSQRQARCFLIAIPVNPVIVASKINAVTVNSLLTTLFLLTMSVLKKRGGESDCISVSTCVDLRKYHRDLSAKNLGSLYNTIVNYFINFPDEFDFKKMCQTVHTALTENIQARATPPRLPEHQVIQSTRVATGIAMQAQNDNTYFQGSIAMSNLGQVPIEPCYAENDDQLKVAAYILFVNQVLGFAEIVPNISTFNDKLFINFTYVRPLHGDKWALDFVLEFLRIAYEKINNFHFLDEWTSQEINHHFKPNFFAEQRLWNSYHHTHCSTFHITGG